MSAGRFGGRLLATVVRGSTRRPLLTVVLATALAAIAVIYTLQELSFVTEHLSLLPQRARYVALLREYQGDFGELNDIIAVVESPSPQLSRDYAVRLQAEIKQRLPSAVVRYRVDPGWIERRGLLYLSVDDLKRLRDRLGDYQDFVTAYAARPSLDQLIEEISRQIATGIAGGFLDLGIGGPPTGDVRFLTAVLDQIDGSLDGRGGYVSPWATAFAVGPDDGRAGWFLSKDQRLLFAFVQPRREPGEFGVNRAAVQTIRAAITALAPEFPAVRAGVTGGPAISSDEMATAFKDSNVATLLALTLTLGLLLLSFRRVGAPMLMLAALVTSLAWSMGIATLVVGSLNIFSVMFISIVVGIGIDYGIYFLYRYDEERALGGTREAALAVTAERTGPGILLGALAATGTFFVLMLTEFRGIREFGFVSGTAVLASFVAMLTLFPALLTLADRRRESRTSPGSARRARTIVLEARSLRRLTSYRWTILAGAAGATALATWGSVGVGFDSNLLRMQARGVESVEWEERVLAQAGRSGFAALATASSLEELRRKQTAFEGLGAVSEVDSVLRLIPDRQDDKIRLIRPLAPVLAPLRTAPVPTLDPARLRVSLSTLLRRLGLVTEAPNAPSEMHIARAKVHAVLVKLAAAPPAAGWAGLERLQQDLARDFADKLHSVQQSLDPRPITAADLPAELRQRYVGVSGRLLLRIHPAVDIWEDAGATRFVGELRSVDRDVTGPPITAFESIRLIRRGYLEGTLYALALVATLTWSVLRSVRATVLTLVPLILGIVWTLGLMRVFDLRFTLANVWAVPLIMGTAAEFGLNVFVRHAEGRETGRSTLPRSGVRAVVLNGLTTIGGFGSLMVARHQGIFGLGLLLTIGSAVSLVAALIVAPVLFQIFSGPSTRSGPTSRVSA